MVLLAAARGRDHGGPQRDGRGRTPRHAPAGGHVPDEAQGQITDADEIVGEITVGGTIGFIVFIGIVGGVVAGAIYLVVRRMLPPRRLGGLAFGAALLIVLGTTVDPLRDENPDFDIVGPDWLSVLVFTAMSLAFGVVLAGFMARLSAWLPPPSLARRTLVRYLPVAAVAVFGFSVTLALVLLGILVVVATRWTVLLDAVRSPMFVRIGRVALLALVVVLAPWRDREHRQHPQRLIRDQPSVVG